MNDRPTPETDAVTVVCSDTSSEWHGDWVSVEDAKRLERERDEAREELDESNTRLINASRMGVDLLVEREDSRRLLREIFNLTQIGDPHPDVLPMMALQTIAEMIHEHLKEACK